jgi:hypothetical protein
MTDQYPLNGERERKIDGVTHFVGGRAATPCISVIHQ